MRLSIMSLMNLLVSMSLSFKNRGGVLKLRTHETHDTKILRR